MTVKNKLLLAVASASLLLAAPAWSQNTGDPYPLEIQCTADQVLISNGVVGLPVALMFGYREVNIVLPEDVMLRVEPVAFVVLGNFNMAGQFSLPIHKAPATGPDGFLMQAISYANDGGKLCTSQLVHVLSEFLEPRLKWYFNYLN